VRELRQDPLTGAWMALCDEAVHFAGVPTTIDEGTSSCPFCDGRSAQHRSSLAQRGAARAWPHDTPVLRVEEGSDAIGDGRRPGLGAHEVVVPSPRHVLTHHLPIDMAVDALVVARDRMADLRRDHRLGRQAWSRRARPGRHGRDTVAAWPELGTPRLERRAIEHAVASAHRDGRDVGAVGAVHVWCSRAPQRPFEVRLAHLGDGGEDAVGDLARALHALELALEQEIGPHGHDAWLRPGHGHGDALLVGCLEVVPVTAWSTPALGGMLPTHGATPEVVAPRLRDRFHTLCHDAASVEVER